MNIFLQWLDDVIATNIVLGVTDTTASIAIYLSICGQQTYRWLLSM